jgi:hypothetical protein
MDEYIERKKAIELIQPHVKPQTVYGEGYLQAKEHVTDILTLMPAADVQPLTVVAEHIKKRLYQTAFNTTEEKERDTIVDMAKRIDIWVDELKVGDVE